MIETEKILNKAFLESIVSINKLNHLIEGEDNLYKEKINKIKLELSAIENVKELKNGKSILSENIYKLEFNGIKEYKYLISTDLDIDTLDFDGDVRLHEIHNENLKGFYELVLKNGYGSIILKFKSVSKSLISSNEFVDPIKTNKAANKK